MRTHTSLMVLFFLAASLHAAEPVLTGPAPVANAPGSQRPDWNPRMTPVVGVVKHVRNAVVNIHSERTTRADGVEDELALAPSQNRVNGMGTGIIIDPRGYILTNQHVVEDVSLLRIRLADGTTQNAVVLARHPETDLALLKIEVAGPLPTMPLGTAT